MFSSYILNFKMETTTAKSLKFLSFIFILIVLMLSFQKAVVGEISPLAPLLRNKRFLIFPRQAPTRHQFIAGIGIPTDLEIESIILGHVLKAEFYLPYNATVFRENPFFPEYTFVNLTSARSQLRWDIYSYIKHKLDSYGYNGQECLLKAICEANAVRFQRHHNIFAELLHVFFSPSTSRDCDTITKSEYKTAEEIGRNAAAAAAAVAVNVAEDVACDIYNCKMSILNIISKVIKTEN